MFVCVYAFICVLLVFMYYIIVRSSSRLSTRKSNCVIAFACSRRFRAVHIVLSCAFARAHRTRSPKTYNLHKTCEGNGISLGDWIKQFFSHVRWREHKTQTQTYISDRKKQRIVHEENVHREEKTREYLITTNNKKTLHENAHTARRVNARSGLA